MPTSGSRRRAPLPAIAVALVSLALAVPAAGQEHAHASAASVSLAHDAPADGRTYMGQPAAFTVLDLGDDAVPDFHQQNRIRVSENGAVLFETTADSGHDYDGVHPLEIVFPQTGTYLVETLDAQGQAISSFSGTVEPAENGAALLRVTAPARAETGTPATFAVALGSPQALVEHSDIQFEVRAPDGSLQFRTHAHIHTEPVELSYTFAVPGTYKVRALGYLAFYGPKATSFPTVLEERDIDVLPRVNPSPPLPAAPSPSDLMVPDNAVAVGETRGGNLTLLGTYDPYTRIAPTTHQHLSVLAMDPRTRMPVPHVDFTAKLIGPDGTPVFASDTLHEYDGILEVTAVTPVPGAYVLTATAQRGEWSGTIRMPYLVLPPALAAGAPSTASAVPAATAGPFSIMATGLADARAGVPMHVTLRTANALGQPLPHSETDLQVLDALGRPLLTTKLHTHDGSYAFTFTAGAPGPYSLRLSPFVQELQPATFSAPFDFPFQVAGGPGIPAIPVSEDAAAPAGAAQAIPAPAGGLLAVGLALALQRRAAHPGRPKT